jgi:hypothetical protein
MDRRVSALLVVLGLAACGGGGTTTPPPPPTPPVTSTPTSIVLSQSTLSLDDTASVQLQATVMDQAGKAMASPPALQWSSADTSLAKVDGTGMVTGRRAGEVEIVAALAGLRAAARATVRAVPSSLTRVSGDAQGAGTGASLADSLVVLVADRHGRGIAGVTVGFQVASGGGSVSRPSAVTGADGLAKTAWTLGAGLANNRVTATAGTLPAVSFVATATASSLVPASGGTLAAGEVKLVFPAGALAQATRITVSTVETADARMVPGTIHDFGPAGTSFAQPVQLSIAYDPALVPSGNPEGKLRLHLWSGYGWDRVPGSWVDVAANVVTGPAYHFSRYAVGPSDAPIEVAVSIQADVSKTAVASALVEVTAADLDEALDAPLTVSGGMASGTLRVPEGAGRRFVVRAHDANGVETHRGSAVASLSSANPTSLNVTLAALDGSVPIVARIGTYVLTISPATPTLRVGETLQMAASATDASGAPVASPAFTWASSNPSLAQVDAAGRVLARYPGTVRIVANYQGLAVAASLTVNP